MKIEETIKQIEERINTVEKNYRVLKLVVEALERNEADKAGEKNTKFKGGKLICGESPNPKHQKN